MNPDFRKRESPGVITAEDVKRAAEIVHLRYAIEAIQRYHRISSRFPGSDAHRTVKFLRKLIRDIPGAYHTHEEQDAWNEQFPLGEEELWATGLTSS